MDVLTVDSSSWNQRTILTGNSSFDLWFVHMQVQDTPVLNREHTLQHWMETSVWSSLPLLALFPRGLHLTRWQPWQREFQPDWWPRMTDDILHAYNQPMRPRGWSSDQECEVSGGEGETGLQGWRAGNKSRENSQEKGQRGVKWN